MENLNFIGIGTGEIIAMFILFIPFILFVVAIVLLIKWLLKRNQEE